MNNHSLAILYYCICLFFIPERALWTHIAMEHFINTLRATNEMLVVTQNLWENSKLTTEVVLQ